VSGLNGLVRILTLHCDEASALSSRELDDSLSLIDRTALICHVVLCNSCRQFRKQIRSIRTAVRDRETFLAKADAAESSLSEEARARILGAWREGNGDDDTGARSS
jgi:hypothetical protein